MGKQDGRGLRRRRSRRGGSDIGDMLHPESLKCCIQIYRRDAWMGLPLLSIPLVMGKELEGTDAAGLGRAVCGEATCVAEGRWVVGGEASYWPAWSKRKLGVMVRCTVTG